MLPFSLAVESNPDIFNKYVEMDRDDVYKDIFNFVDRDSPRRKCHALVHAAVSCFVTSWQYARNWQMEIAFFDLAWCGCIIYAFKVRNHLLQKQIAVVLGCLSVCLGGNHFSGFLAEGKILHLVFAVLNYVAVVSAILFIVAGRKLVASKQEAVAR